MNTKRVNFTESQNLTNHRQGFFPSVNVKLLLITGFIACLTSCSKEVDDLTIENDTTNQVGKKDKVKQVKPLFINSIVSTDIDFIKSSDPDTFSGLKYVGNERKEMPDSREGRGLFDQSTYVFEVSFKKSKKIIEIWAHSSFKTRTEARKQAKKAATRLGKLPNFMRNKLDHVVIHKGNEGAFADEKFFILYSKNMDVRIKNKDLEETIFHESVHATLDNTFGLNSKKWKDTQKKDGNFITDYAKDNVFIEDLAESAIFVYTMKKYPKRLSSKTSNWIKNHIPNRYAYIKNTVFKSVKSPKKK